MKALNTVIKILTALAAIAGVVYLLATYGDKIVAWAKKLLNCGGGCCCEDECCCEEACSCEEECCCQEDGSCEASAEEAPAEETPAEEAPAAEEPAVQESDFEA